MLNTIRIHKRQVLHEILGERLNRGQRLRLLLNYFIWHARYKYGGKKWTIQFDNGMKSIVYPFPDHDAGEANIWTRNVDWYDTEFTRENINKGDFVVDGGCNVGNRTLAIADLLGGALFIDAGETACRRTNENLLLNGLDNKDFRVARKALGATIGEICFTDLGGASTRNKVVEVVSAEQKTVRVPLTTLDEECFSTGRIPSFIKLDLEGNELSALRGATRLLKVPTLRLIKFERNDSEPLKPITDLMSEADWQVFALTDEGHISLSPELIERRSNLFASPRAVFPSLKSVAPR